MQPGICDECTRGSFYSMGWLINLKDNEIPYYVDKTFEECSKWQYFWMRNKWQYSIYIHYPVTADHGLGCSQNPWMCTIHIHPSSKLQIDWICSGLAGGGWVPWVEGAGLCFTWFHICQAGQRSTVHHPLHGTWSTTAHLTDWSWHAIPPIPSGRAQACCPWSRSSLLRFHQVVLVLLIAVVVILIACSSCWGNHPSLG